MDIKETLRLFWNDKNTLTVVQDFINTSLEELAVNKAMAREDTSGIADASDAINLAFSKLDSLFEENKKPVITSDIR